MSPIHLFAHFGWQIREPILTTLRSTLNRAAIKAVFMDDYDLRPAVYEFRYAVYDDEPLTVRRLISQGMDINVRDGDGGTALMWAVDAGHLNLTRQLLRWGADVNASDDQGWTALHNAVQTNNYEIAHVLLWAQADVSAAAKDGSTALSIARRNNNYNMERALRRFGAK